MLTYSRNILRFTAKSGSTRLCRYFSSINPAINEFEFENDNNDTPVVEQKVFSTDDLFENVFATSNTNIYQAREGAVVDVSKDDLKIYFPEGLAGEMDDEFELINGSSWMIRDSSKLLCRILDEFVATKGDKLGALVVPKSIVTNINISTLTDRPEWDSAKISIKHFGKELVTPAETLSDNQTVAGQGSLVDNCIDNFRQLTSDFPKHILLTGDRGTGKSASINQMVLHARKSGWLVLFVPKGWDHVQRGDFVLPLEDGSKLYDNQQMSAEALRGFWRAHQDKLRTLPITNLKALDKYAPELALFDEEWNRVASMPGRERDSFMQMRAILANPMSHDEDQDEKDKDVLAGFQYKGFEPRTLEDLVRFGLAFREFSGRVFMDLVEEVKKVDAYPVLVAVDQYNAWETDSAFQYDYLPVHSKDIVVPHTLGFISRSLKNGKLIKSGAAPSAGPLALKYGLCVAATSLRHTDCKHVTFNESNKSLVLNIKVPNYSQIELLSTVSKYAYKDVLEKGITLQEFLAFRTHVGSNPHHARKEAIPFFFPLAVKKDSVRLSEEHSYFSNNDPSDRAFSQRRQAATDAEGGDHGEADDEIVEEKM